MIVKSLAATAVMVVAMGFASEETVVRAKDSMNEIVLNNVEVIPERMN